MESGARCVCQIESTSGTERAISWIRQAESFLVDPFSALQV